MAYTLGSCSVPSGAGSPHAGDPSPPDIMDTLAEAYDDSAVVALKSHVVLRGLLSPEASIHTTITS